MFEGVDYIGVSVVINGWFLGIYIVNVLIIIYVLNLSFFYLVKNNGLVVDGFESFYWGIDIIGY